MATRSEVRREKANQIGFARRKLYDAAFAATDHQRHLRLHREWERLKTVQIIELAVKVETFAGQQATDDLDELDQPAQPPAACLPVPHSAGREVLGEAAGAETAEKPTCSARWVRCRSATLPCARGT